jgi:hypothetical protein
MYRLLISTFLSIISCAVFAQTEAQLDRLAVATCSCMAAKDVEKMDASMLQTEIGTCMLSIVAKDPDSKTLMGFLRDAKSGQQFGEKIGANLAKYCPDLVMKMAQKMDPAAFENGQATSAAVAQTATVTVKEVRIGEFVTFVSTDEKGREMKFVWVEPFDGDATLMEKPDGLKGKKAEISFIVRDKYDPRLKEYVPMKVVSGLKML